MCARRFLFVVFLLTLLAVGGAFAIFQFGDRVLIRNATPKGHFTAPPPASGPDYANAASWLARPGLPDDPSQWRPTDDPRPLVPKPAHFFYCTPTTYRERDAGRPRRPFGRANRADCRGAQAIAFNDIAAGGRRATVRGFGAFLLKSDDATAG